MPYPHGEALKAAFQKAVDRSSGPARAVFERVNVAFDNRRAAAELGVQVLRDAAKEEFHEALVALKAYVKTDPEAAVIKRELVADVLHAAQLLPEAGNEMARKPKPPRHIKL